MLITSTHVPRKSERQENVSPNDLRHRKATLGDLADYAIRERTDTFFQPIVVGAPETTLWLKLTFVKLLTAQMVEATIVQSLIHPQTGELLYKEGDLFTADFNKMRVAITEK